jgi:hypothetical protein
LGSFFHKIVVFGRKSGKIGFVLHKKADLSNILYWSRGQIVKARNPNIEIRNNIKIQMSQFQNNSLEAKSSASIIRGSCAFDTKKWLDSGCTILVSRLLERNKKFFGKIEKFRFLLSKLVENWGDFRQIRAKGTST